MRFISVSALLFISVVSAHAGVITHNFGFDPSDADPTTDWNKTLTSVQKFNSSLGTLQSVTVSYTGTINSVWNFENRSPNSGATLTGTSTAALDLLMGSDFDTADRLLSLSPGVSVSYQVGKYDGITDFAGTSGRSQLFSETKSGSVLYTGADLNRFIGSGSFSFLATASASVGYTVTGGNNRVLVETGATTSGSVTYNYVAAPVPEPASMTALVLGVATLVRRRKR